jgi:DNA-binding transcriptional regulator YiaG
MTNRCYNPNDRSFKHYGGRGIKICEEWRNDYRLFEIWALKNGYKKGLQIDRKNNDGDYEPGNCKFSTSTENNRNKRNTIMNQESVKKLRQIRQKTNYTQKQIAKMFGISTSLVRDIVSGKLWKIK